MVNYKIMNYTAHISSPSNTSADVVETTTNQVIRTLPSDKARELCRSLNFGAGFDGWTPAFFLEKNANIFYSEEERV
jgi:hypothetical protein